MGYFAGSRPDARMSAKPAKADQPESFEHALAELEKIVATMESGKLTLEQSLPAHQRGLELAQYCQGVLARAQQQVKVLEENTLKSLPGADDERFHDLDGQACGPDRGDAGALPPFRDDRAAAPARAHALRGARRRQADKTPA